MPNTINPNFKPVSDQLIRLMNASWRRMFQAAHKHIHYYEGAQDYYSTDTTDYSEVDFYERERQFLSDFDTLGALLYEGHGYLAFISAVTLSLEYENFISMFYLKHVIHNSGLRSRETMLNISLAIMDHINKKATPTQHMLFVSSTKVTMNSEDLENEALRKQLVTIQPSSTMTPLLTMEQSKIKRNACSIWSILAEKHAGSSCLLLWNNDVRDLCFHSLSNTQEDSSVRIASLLALEKFALTGAVKKLILAHDIDIRSILINIVLECEVINKRIYLYNKCKNMNSIFYVPPLFYTASKLTEAGQIYPFTTLNCFNIEFVPENPVLFHEWMKYSQLSMMCRWSLDHTFKAADNSVTCPWDLSHASVIMNPFDSTTHMKIGGNGVELRNDRYFFESIRATACVKSGKWYYETLVLTGGIILVGWANAKCRFSPEDKLGVGDDSHGFAFDIFRSCIWTSGIANHTVNAPPCKPGDVIGMLLDLDNGSSTFFINGEDVGHYVSMEPRNERTERDNLDRPSMDFDSSSQDPSSMSMTESYAPMSPMSGVSKSSASSRKSSQKQTEERPGLYPAISLTANQHVIVNFGDRSWMCPPETDIEFDAFCNAGCLDETYIRKFHNWVKKHGVMSPSLSSDSLDSEVDDGDDGTDDHVCIVCCREPQNAVLHPCGHGLIGRACANRLSLCPLCRCQIEDRAEA